MKIYIVGDSGPEHNSIFSIHETYKGALKSWNKLRIDLLNKAKYSLKKNHKWSRDMYMEMIKNLSCTDPEKIDNYPQETPYIREYKLEK